MLHGWFFVYFQKVTSLLLLILGVEKIGRPCGQLGASRLAQQEKMQKCVFRIPKRIKGKMRFGLAQKDKDNANLDYKNGIRFIQKDMKNTNLDLRLT